jgi:hypothetical protein
MKLLILQIWIQTLKLEVQAMSNEENRLQAKDVLKDK